jgi:hypothetical protein
VKTTEQSGLTNWLFDRLASQMGKPPHEEVFAPHIQANMRQLARDSLAKELGSTNAPTSPQRLSEFWISQKMRREIALQTQALRSVGETRLPFIDNQLVSLVLSAPQPLTFDDKIPWTILARRHPKMLRIVNDTTGLPIGAGKWRHQIAKGLDQGLRKLGLVSSQSGRQYREWLCPTIARLATDVLLNPMALDRNVYNARGIQAAIENHFDGKLDHTNLLVALTTFELGQRYLAAGAPN